MPASLAPAIAGLPALPVAASSTRVARRGVADAVITIIHDGARRPPSSPRRGVRRGRGRAASTRSTGGGPLMTPVEEAGDDRRALLDDPPSGRAGEDVRGARVD